MALYSGIDTSTVVKSGSKLPVAYDGVLGSPQTITYYTMGVWHLSLNKTITWEVQTNPDPTGASYPGPGTFGVNTQSTAHIEKTELR